MTKPDDIPQDVWDKAEHIADTSEPSTETLARAIMAEREACAVIAETRSPDDDRMDFQTRQQAAAAIRNRGAP